MLYRFKNQSSFSQIRSVAICISIKDTFFQLNLTVAWLTQELCFQCCLGVARAGEGPWNAEKYCWAPWLPIKKDWILDALEWLKMWKMKKYDKKCEQNSNSKSSASGCCLVAHFSLALVIKVSLLKKTCHRVNRKQLNILKIWKHDCNIWNFILLLTEDDSALKTA